MGIYVVHLKRINRKRLHYFYLTTNYFCRNILISYGNY